MNKYYYQILYLNIKRKWKEKSYFAKLFNALYELAFKPVQMHGNYISTCIFKFLKKKKTNTSIFNKIKIKIIRI